MIFVRVLGAAGPVVAEAGPGREQDDGAEPRAGFEAQRLDFRVRVQEVGEDAQGQVGARGVAAHEEVFGPPVQGGEDVVEDSDALL